VVSPPELAPIDQFHVRGLVATAELAAAAGIGGGDVVLDIGSGLGGASRYLAAECGARVFGIDLSPHFVAAAGFLAARTGLSGLVDYRCGNALALPFEAGRFDVVWTQHVAMNIANRDGLCAEAFRVLRPGGRFAIYDVVAEAGREVMFPVPWARTAEASFLLTAGEMRAALERQGFQVVSWVDQREAALAWFDAQDLTTANAPTGMNLRTVMGPEFPVMARNIEVNLREGRVGVVQVVMGRG